MGGVVHLLCKNGADINTKNMLGRSAFEDSICNGHHDVAKYLINKGADTMIRNTVRNRHN
jgi:ankyrin repeat protein